MNYNLQKAIKTYCIDSNGSMLMEYVLMCLLILSGGALAFSDGSSFLSQMVGIKPDAVTASDFGIAGVILNQKIPAIEHFINQQTIKQAYSFDLFDYEVPRISRKEPVGIYDKLLGYEFMYDYLKNIHTDMMTLNIEDLPFKPEIYIARSIFSDVEKFLTYVDRDENLWFHNGKLNDYINYCRTIPPYREKIIAECSKDAKGKDKRTQILAQGIASYFSTGNIHNKELNEKLANEFLQLTRTVQRKDRDFSRSMPEEQIKIRDEIISIGFPGDPIVRKMWRMRPPEQRRK